MDNNRGRKPIYNDKNLKRYTFRITDELLEKIKEQASKQGMTTSEFIRFVMEKTIQST